jgi:hypothetical protein
MTLGYSTKFPWGGPTRFPEKIILGEKVHTIRQDLKKRWRQGRPIQHVTGNRTKLRDMFLENECDGVQTIKILFTKEAEVKRVIVDGIDIPEWKTIAENDGLTVDQFTKWFYSASEAEVFTGVIIHWTNLRY